MAGVIQTIVTNAGIAAAIAAGNHGPLIDIESFQIGSDIIDPDPTMTGVFTGGVEGGTVYMGTGAQMQYELINPNTVCFVITLDETVGNFTIGNIGLFTASGVMFAISALPLTEPKQATVGGGLGTRRVFNIFLTISQLATISNFTIQQTSVMSLPEVANETLLPNPASSVFNTYLIDDLEFTGRGFPALGSRVNGEWWYVQLGDNMGDMPYTQNEANALFAPKSTAVQPIAVGYSGGSTTEASWNAGALAFNGANIGVNGMDAGEMPVLNDLYIYEIYSTVGGTATYGTTGWEGAEAYGGVLPEGYNGSKLIWSGKTDSNGHIPRFAQVNNIIFPVYLLVVSGGGATSYTPVSIADLVPFNTKSVYGSSNTGFTDLGGSVWVASDGSGIGQTEIAWSSGLYGDVVGEWGPMPIVTPQIMYYYVTTPGLSQMYIVLTAYTI